MKDKMYSHTSHALDSSLLTESLTEPTTQPGTSSKVSNGTRIGLTFGGLYTENCLAKIWDVASRYITKLPGEYPETVPSDGEQKGQYSTREARFWTCGFFPGSLYSLLERSSRFPKALSLPAHVDTFQLHDQLLMLCREWSAPLHFMATRRDTHDLGFIVLPSLRMDWELTGNRKSLEAVVTAANSLASRFDERVGAVRSWDKMHSKRYDIDDRENNFLVIIDSMCNMDLLFYAGYHSRNQKLIDIATAHAHTVLRTIVREDFSTFHVCNFNPRNGEVQYQQTHQGYSDNSTWSRGQAWAILGFAQTYAWTKDPIFLHAATKLSDYFLKRLSESSHCHPYVPLWDFDAPVEGGQVPPRDTSAAMIAANGFLIMHQMLHGRDGTAYLDAAIRIAEDVVAHSLAPEQATIHIEGDGRIVAHRTGFDSILMNATANKNKYALMPYWDHGLVYADYYFLEFGNRLLRMGLV